MSEQQTYSGLLPESQGLSPEEKVKQAEARLRAFIATEPQLNDDLDVLRYQHQVNMTRYQLWFDDEFESVDEEIDGTLGLILDGDLNDLMGSVEERVKCLRERIANRKMVEYDLDSLEETVEEQLDFLRERLENLQKCLLRRRVSNRVN